MDSNGNSVAGNFAYDPPAGTLLHAGPNRKLSAIFTPTQIGFASAAISTTIDIDPANLLIVADNSSVAQGFPLLPLTWQVYGRLNAAL